MSSKCSIPLGIVELKSHKIGAPYSLGILSSREIYIILLSSSFLREGVLSSLSLKLVKTKSLAIPNIILSALISNRMIVLVNIRGR